MSDTTDLGIIIILVFGLIINTFYVRRLIDSKYDINSIKCNPINLFLKSINEDPRDSVNSFGECVQLFSEPNESKDTTENN